MTERHHFERSDTKAQAKRRSASGIYHWLTVCPAWLTLLTLYIGCIALLPLGRKLFEGVAYNVALSSKWGDLALICCVLIAERTLRKQTVEIPWINRRGFHATCRTLALLVGIGLQVRAAAVHGWRFGEIMDCYHNLIIVPVFLYLLVAALPIVYVYGTRVQKLGTVALLLLWGSLVCYDFATGRLEQQSWLRLYHTETGFRSAFLGL